MPIAQSVLRKLHEMKIESVDDPSSRFSFKFSCGCGVQGLFYTKEEAEKYQHFHKIRQGIIDAESSA